MVYYYNGSSISMERTLSSMTVVIIWFLWGVAAETAYGFLFLSACAERQNGPPRGHPPERETSRAGGLFGQGNSVQGVCGGVDCGLRAAATEPEPQCLRSDSIFVLGGYIRVLVSPYIKYCISQ